MSLPKMFAITAFILFFAIGVAAILKKNGKSEKAVQLAIQDVPLGPIEVELEQNVRIMQASQPEWRRQASAGAVGIAVEGKPVELSQGPLPAADRVAELFNKKEPKFPIVDTVTYRSRVSWLKGRPAWLSDYASYYSTSRHFIARSLNGKPDYFKQDVAEGDRFNVLRKEKSIQFYLLVDIARHRLWLYYLDLDTNQRVLVKDYPVGLGRVDSSKESGLLTPLGKYTLGNRIAIFKPKMMGQHNGQRVEMMRVFGTRWIPFDSEVSGTTAPAKGLGIHGVPWKANEKGELVEDLTSLGKYMSDGCIRLATADIEEIFAIIITKPAVIELVQDYFEAKLPGIEK